MKRSIVDFRKILGDPRNIQTAILTGLLLYGWLFLDFVVTGPIAATFIITAIATQYIATVWVGLPVFDPRSALISSLSLCLLLRTSSVEVAVGAAIVSMSSKFLFRAGGKHIFNPTNFGICVALAFSNKAWVSPGYWGNGALFAFMLACVGLLVVFRSKRTDITWAFIAFYVALAFGRALWLGDPLSIPLQHIKSGAFILFSFFMISDPKTGPNARTGRIIYAALVAGVAFTIHFALYTPNGFLWALIACAPLTPLIDRLFDGNVFQWPGAAKHKPITLNRSHSCPEFMSLPS